MNLRFFTKENLLKIWGPLLLVVLFFIAVSYFVQANNDVIRNYIEKRSLVGMLVYLGANLTAVVVAPVSALPLIPVAANVWGWFVTGILNIIGWTAGAVIAFVLAQKYGKPIIKRLVSIEKLEKIEKILPEQSVFWGVVFLRMVTPVDGLSYALGLFSKMSLWQFFLATLIGITPFSFVFAYAGTLPVVYQILALGAAIVIFISGWMFMKKRKEKQSANQ